MPNDEPPPFDAADPYSVEFLRWVRDSILATLDEHSRQMEAITQSTRKCVDHADKAIRGALDNPRPTDDETKAVVLERLQELRDALHDTL